MREPVAASPAGDPITHRILTIDGGGIYGLLSAVWLRKLCEQDPSFLRDDQIDLFAGVSSGAINTLLLARHEHPREALLASVLEEFWARPVGVFSHTNPATRLLSWLGLTPWFGAEDMERVLVEHFGDMRLQ